MIIDLEIFILIWLIIILIYNYKTNECYKYFKCNKNKKQEKYDDMVKFIDDKFSYHNYYMPIDETFINKSNKKYPDIELEGYSNNNDTTDMQKIPDNIFLNDRYNDHITPYTDDQLTNIIAENIYDTSYNDYSQSLINDLQKNIIFDMDTKITNKNKQVQKLAKDSATIASRFGRNSLLETYKNELDEYEKEKTPWWTESD